MITGKIKKHDKNSTGYVRVTLQNKNHNPNTQRFFVHRLVVIHFIPNPNNLPEVNHINSNTECNNYKNLEWVNKKENELHSHKYGSKEYKPFKVIFKDGCEKKFEVKQDLADELNITRQLVKYWLHKTSYTYYKYGIKEVNYI